MSVTQAQKAAQFKALHQSGCFIIPNPWDAGSARLLAGMGFAALATSSGAAAGVLGRKDGEINRDEALAHARVIVMATDLPVAADLENGFGDTPADAALTIRGAAEVGLVGGSIEDSSGVLTRKIYDFNHAVERVAAATEAAHAQAFPFTLTARCENFLRGNPDLDDTIRRLQAYEKAGADVLFAPGLPGIDAIRTVVKSIGKPLNVVQTAGGIPLAELEAAGVRRVSTGGGLARVSLTALKKAGEEMLATGTFKFADDILTTAWLNDLMRR